MKDFWKWVYKPFNKPNYLVTAADSLRMVITVIIGFVLFIIILWFILVILDKLGIIRL